MVLSVQCSFQTHYWTMWLVAYLNSSRTLKMLANIKVRSYSKYGCLLLCCMKTCHFTKIKSMMVTVCNMRKKNMKDLNDILDGIIKRTNDPQTTLQEVCYIETGLVDTQTTGTDSTCKKELKETLPT